MHGGLVDGQCAALCKPQFRAHGWRKWRKEGMFDDLMVPEVPV